MISYIISIAAFLVIGCIEISFINSLPFPWNLFPLMLIIGIFVLQQINTQIGLLWIIGSGVLMDFLVGYNHLPQFIHFTLLAILLVIISRFIFSTRSYYSLLALSFITVIFLFGYDLALGAILSIFANYNLEHWAAELGRTYLWTLLFIVCSFTVMLFFEKKIKKIFNPVVKI